MSKLKISLILSLLILLPVGVYFTVKKQAPKKNQHLSRLFSEETRLWGKAVGPVQVRIEFKSQSGNQVTLLGQVRSTLPQFEIQWVLPKGVRLVEGSLSENVQQASEEQKVYDRQITVEVDWPLETPHLVLRAGEGSDTESFGATTVFNLDPSLEDLEKEEIIRAHMNSRQIQKLVK